MFEDAENAQELPPPTTPIQDFDFVMMEHWHRAQGEYSFTKSVSGTDSDALCSSCG